MAKLSLTYDGTVQPPSGQWNELVQTELYPYLPDEDLMESVNLSLILGKPLLLEGEPGCGKSRLAYALAYELSQRNKENDLQWKFQLWNIQSTSKAQEGFYIYDYIGRLQAAELSRVGVKQSGLDPQNTETFVEYGPIGQAFKDKNCQTVILIDEIDKADSDFANDLLLVLEEKRFEIKELRKQDPKNVWVKANRERLPIVIITSNQEKKLSPAFLRRCLYHFIDFPSKDKLIKILNERFRDVDNSLVDASVSKFLALRNLMDEDKGQTGKKVSVSEFVDWFDLLSKKPLKKALSDLGAETLIHRSALLKTQEDYEEYLDV